jgi:hypothetical protein
MTKMVRFTKPDPSAVTWKVAQWGRFHLLRTRFLHFGFHRCGSWVGGLGGPGIIIAFGPAYVVIDL